MHYYLSFFQFRHTHSPPDATQTHMPCLQLKVWRNANYSSLIRVFTLIIIFEFSEQKQHQTMFPHNIYTNTYSKPLQNPSASYYLVDPALLHSLTSNIEQMKQREQKLSEEVKQLREECEDLKMSFNDNLESMVRECLNQQLNSKQESQHFSLCIKSHKCKIKGCSKRYSSKTALMAHLRSKHETSEYYD